MAERRAILIVDDEFIILMALKQELISRYGREFLLETALDPAEAEAIIDELAGEGVSVILVISDWLMPGMKGDEFLSRVRADFPRIRTIMVSGQANPDDVARIREAGDLDAYFMKPWDPARLVAACRKLLEEAGDGD